METLLNNMIFNFSAIVESSLKFKKKLELIITNGAGTGGVATVPGMMSDKGEANNGGGSGRPTSQGSGPDSAGQHSAQRIVTNSKTPLKVKAELIDMEIDKNFNTSTGSAAEYED